MPYTVGARARGVLFGRACACMLCIGVHPRHGKSCHHPLAARHAACASRNPAHKPTQMLRCPHSGAPARVTHTGEQTGGSRSGGSLVMGGGSTTGEGKPVGVGLHLVRAATGEVLVRDVKAGGVAAAAGVQPGSAILSVDGNAVSGMDTRQVHVLA